MFSGGVLGEQRDEIKDAGRATQARRRFLETLTNLLG
jgi:hypothetical protein